MSDLTQGRPAKRVQYAALPYRRGSDSQVEVLLITSRDTRRWVIPKGWPKTGKAPHLSAAHEAFEEAGVAGIIDEIAIGSYLYDKRLEQGETVACEVHVFALEVTQEHEAWPEQAERDVVWVAPNDAAEMVYEPLLRELLRGFTSML